MKAKNREPDMEKNMQLI